jgi:hypothetical protein
MRSRVRVTSPVTLLGAALVVSLPLAIAAPAARADEAENTASSLDDPSHWLRELDVEAGRLDADLRLRELELSEGVRVCLSPYYLHADRIHLSLSPWGVRVVGDGQLSFCPCDAPPLTIGFAGGWAAPPNELIVESPTLRLFGVPILWLPYLWLRSPRKVGLSIPELSVRGRDGVYFGESLHLPLLASGEGNATGAEHGLELGAGLYATGGFAAGVDLASPRTFLRARFDWRGEAAAASGLPSGSGLSLDAWGAFSRAPFTGPDTGPSVRLAWDVDALRGPRAARTELSLEPLARPWDRGVVEAGLGPLAVGASATAARGDALDRLDVFTPYVSLGGGGSIGNIGAIEAAIDGGPRLVRGPRGDLTVDARSELTLAGPTWPVLWSSTLRLDARGGRPFAVGSSDLPIPTGADARGGAALAELRLEASLPLARPLDVARARGGPPVLHVIEPLIRGAALGALAEGPQRLLVGFPAAAIFTPDAQGDALPVTRKYAGAAAVGARTRLGTLGGGIAPGLDPFLGGVQAELVAGGLALEGRRDAALAGSLALDLHHRDGGGLDLRLDGALARSFTGDATLAGALLGLARFATARDGFGLELRAAVRSDVPPLGLYALLGRDLAPWIASSTWLARSGTTAGASTSLPLGAGLAVSGGVDAFVPPRARFGDALGDASLLDVHGTLRYRHPCGCFRVALRGAHVVGRGGVDVFASLELAQRAPEDPRNYGEW